MHFKKRQSIEQAFSKCQEHNAGHVVGALKSTLPTVSAQISAISAWWHNFWGKYETICPVFKNHSCQLFFSPISATKTFHKHSFLLAVSHFPYHSRIATQLLTSQGPVTWPFDRSSIRRSEVENATFWSAKNVTRNIFWPKFFLQWCFICSE